MTPAWLAAFRRGDLQPLGQLPKGVQGIELIAELSIFAGPVGPLVSELA
jgi:hypothetical protein